MTQPAPPPDQQEPQQGLQHPVVDATAVALIAAALASLVGLPSLPSADRRRTVLTSGPGQIITGILVGQGVPQPVAQAVLAMTAGNSPIPNIHTGRRAPTSDAVRRDTQTENLQRRAAYIVNAARRVADDYRRRAAAAAQPGAVSLVDRAKALRDALARERAYWRAHVQAQQQRNRAARDLDAQARAHGATLGWYAVRDDTGQLDSRVTKACRDADGRNFTVGRRPAIGYPGGLGPHVRCRCRSGPPHATNRTVYDVAPD